MSRSKGVIQARDDVKLIERASPEDFADAADVLMDLGKRVPLASSLQVQLAAAICRRLSKLEPGKVLVAIAVVESTEPILAEIVDPIQQDTHERT